MRREQHRCAATCIEQGQPAALAMRMAKPCVGALTCGPSDTWASRPEPWHSSGALAGDKLQPWVLGLATEGQPSDGLGPAAA